MSPGQSQSHIPYLSSAVDTIVIDNSHITLLNSSSIPRNIGCENSHICFFSSFDCANINRDVITNSIADFGPWLDRQIIVPHPPFLSPIHLSPSPHSYFLFPIRPSSSPVIILLIITLHYSLLIASTTTTHFLEKKLTFLSSHSRNIGCENSRTCFFSSFDCANINRDVITNSIADFGPWLDRQIIVPHPTILLPHHPPSSLFTLFLIFSISLFIVQ